MVASSAASSLYSGIFNTEPEQESPVVPPQVQDTHAVATTSSACSDEKPDNSSHAESTAQKPQAWSAALRFAPRKNAQTNRPKKQVPSVLLSTAFSGESTSIDPHPLENAPSSVSHVQHAESFGKDSKIAEPRPSVVSGIKRAPALGLQTRALQVDQKQYCIDELPIVMEPPSLSLTDDELERDRLYFAELAEKRGEKPFAQHMWEEQQNSDEDVNGFYNSTEGKKAKKRKQKRRRYTSPGRHGGLVASLNMDADYDVQVPNDYSDFKSILRKRREALRKIRKEAETEEALRRAGYVSPEDEEDSEDDHKRKKKSRFAPPSIYKSSQGFPSATEEEHNDDDKPYLSLTPPPEAQDIKQISVDHTINQKLQPPGPPPALPPSLSQAREPLARESSVGGAGEDAYQKRVAMTQHMPKHKSLSPPPFSPSYTSQNAQHSDLAARTAAAAAIAARLGRQDPTASTSAGNIDEPTSTSFAERLMAKQGWVRGQGLGAEGNKGMLDPILAEKVKQERSKVKAAQEDERAAGRSDTRGTVINTQDEEKRRQDREKYGEASEIILLENMIGRDEEIDDDLSGEIGDECAKYGYVQRVFIWPAYRSAEFGLKLGPRVFVKFSGMAGAWRCLKELDGRFFAGHIVSARYYSPSDFAKGFFVRQFE